MLLWLSLLFKRRRSSPHNVESAGRLTCAFYNLQLFHTKEVWNDGDDDDPYGYFHTENDDFYAEESAAATMESSVFTAVEGVTDDGCVETDAESVFAIDEWSLPRKDNSEPYSLYAPPRSDAAAEILGVGCAFTRFGAVARDGGVKVSMDGEGYVFADEAEDAVETVDSYYESAGPRARKLPGASGAAAPERSYRLSLAWEPVGGSVSGVTYYGETYPYGEQVRVVATPDEGEYFEGWYKAFEGELVSLEPEAVITMTNDFEIVAWFHQLEPLELSVRQDDWSVEDVAPDAVTGGNLGGGVEMFEYAPTDDISLWALEKPVNEGVYYIRYSVAEAVPYAAGSVTNVFEIYSGVEVNCHALGGAFPDGSDTRTETVLKTTGYSVLAEAVPEREGYEFAGWYFGWTNGAAKVEAEMPIDAAERNVYAKWISKTVGECAGESAIACADGCVSGPKNVAALVDGDGAFAVPDRVTNGEDGAAVFEIAADAFIGTKYPAAFKSLVTPVYLKAIGSRAFYAQTALKHLVITPPRDYADPTQSAELTIGAKAFAGTALETVVIPEGVTSIGNLAFNNCSKLRTVTFLGDATKASLPANAFQRCGYANGKGTLKVYASKEFAANNAAFFSGLAAVNPGVDVVPMIGYAEATATGIAALETGSGGTIALVLTVDTPISGSLPDLADIRIEWAESLGGTWNEAKIVSREALQGGSAIIEFIKPESASAFFRIKE